MTTADDKWILSGINEWSQLLHTYSWDTYTLVHIDFEVDRMVGGYDFTFIILGLGFTLRHNTQKGLDTMQQWIKEAEEKYEDITPHNV